MAYVKAAFESLTLRPNFDRAYDEGVQDFLEGNFSKKDFSVWSGNATVAAIDRICGTLSGKIPGNARIILNQLPDQSQKAEIIKTFERHFPHARWEEIPVRIDSGNASGSARLREYLFYHVPQLLVRCLTFFNRRDVIISPLAVPFLYNLASARYAVLVNQSSQCCCRSAKIVKGFYDLFRMLVKGIWTALFRLPYAIKNNKKLNSALHNKFGSSRK